MRSLDRTNCSAKLIYIITFDRREWLNSYMLLDDVERTIRTTPGLTATQIARELFGHNGYGERVRSVCQTLHKLGRIERTGKGGPGDPFRFYPAAAAASNSNSMSGKASSLSLGDIVIGRTTAGRMKYLHGQLIRSPLAE